MSEVITWRQMAGPNFSGTAAAMDDAGDRLKQGTDLFTQFAGDQAKVFQQQKAKVKADNTARALTEIGALRDLGALDAAAPALTFESLKAKFGDDIDAGVVAQAANNQRSLIQQNQLKDIQFNEAKLAAEEAPIVGEAKEAMAAAVASGDKGKMAEVEAFYTPKLRDASFLGQARQEFDETQFNRNLQQSQENRAVTSSKQQTTLFNREQERLNKEEAENTALGKQLQANLSGEANGFTVDFTKSNDPIRLGQKVLNANATLIQQMDLPPEIKGKLQQSTAFGKIVLDRADTYVQDRIAQERKTKPVAHPAVSQFYNGLSTDERTALASVTTPEGVISDTLKKIGVQPEGQLLDDTGSDVGSNTFRTELQNRLGKGNPLSSFKPAVVAAAMQGLVPNNDGKLTESDINDVAKRLVEYNAKQTEYVKNEENEAQLKKSLEEKKKDFSSALTTLENLKLRKAKLVTEENTNNLYRTLQGKDKITKDFTDVQNKLDKTLSDLGSLGNEIGLPPTLIDSLKE